MVDAVGTEKITKKDIKEAVAKVAKDNPKLLESAADALDAGDTATPEQVEARSGIEKLIRKQLGLNPNGTGGLPQGDIDAAIRNARMGNRESGKDANFDEISSPEMDNKIKSREELLAKYTNPDKGVGLGGPQ